MAAAKEDCNPFDCDTVDGRQALIERVLPKDDCGCGLESWEIRQIAKQCKSAAEGAAQAYEIMALRMSGRVATSVGSLSVSKTLTDSWIAMAKHIRCHGIPGCKAAPMPRYNRRGKCDKDRITDESRWRNPRCGCAPNPCCC